MQGTISERDHDVMVDLKKSIDDLADQIIDMFGSGHRSITESKNVSLT